MSILVTLCIVLFSITIHEAGHFFAAKIFNYAIEEFSIGMGPKLLQKVKNGTAYTIRLLPLGGYVSFAEESEKKRCIYEPSFLNFIVLIMGAVFNLLLSILCLAIALGIAGATFFSAIYGSIEYTISILFSLPSLLGNIDNYASIVGLANTTNELMSIASNSKETIIYILLIGNSLNLGLAIANLLPLPILDGGQIVINAIELIIKRSISKNTKAVINVISWLLIIVLLVFLMIRDIISLI